MLGVFWLTTDCNMKCIYCYEGNEKKKMYMNEETIDKAIEFLMTRAKELKDKRMNIECIELVTNPSHSALNIRHSYTIKSLSNRTNTLYVYTL